MQRRDRSILLENSQDEMKKPAPLKSAKKAPAGQRQKFDAAGAKRDAMAMFDVSLNNFRRGPDNKWQRKVKS